MLTAVIFWWGYGFSYLGVTAFTVWIYIWFTIRASDWRINIRRDMNDSDTDANTKAIDSLLNFETVKYFRQRGDGSQALRSVHGEIREVGDAGLDLAWLAQLRPGRDLRRWHAHHAADVGDGRAERHPDDRRLRLYQRHAAAAFRAADFIGFVYREIRRA